MELLQAIVEMSSSANLSLPEGLFLQLNVKLSSSGNLSLLEMFSILKKQML